MARQIGDKFILKYPHNDDHNRLGELLAPKAWWYQEYQLWEVILYATETKPEITTFYNAFWLHQMESKS